MSLGTVLDSQHFDESDEAFAAFEEWAWEQRALRLYPAQEEAVLGIALGSNVILATPTGTGKSLVAIGAHFIALAEGRRTVYTAPIKALVSEKFFDLVDVFGADRVGMVTGDTSINPDAPILCCTAEILANLAIRDRSAGGITQVVMDEFHFYAEPDRGWAWQVPLLLMNDAQFLLMSATLGDVSELADDLSRRTGRDTAIVTGVERPVPLTFSYEVAPAHEVVERLVEDRQTPAYLVHFNQSHAVEQAQALSSIRIVDRAGRDEIAAAIGDFRFSTGFGSTLSRLVRSGIGVHHAGMLPRYRRLVEQLAQRGLLRVICGTDTLGVGINVPIRTVVITALTKFDGEKMRRLSAREFHQIAGRAGRAGFDTEGDVVALAPEHEVENAKAAAKAAAKAIGGKKAKPAKKKSPPQGFVAWNEGTLEKLVGSQPEPLVSRMRVTHAMVLGVIGRGETREGEALETMRTLVFDSHEPRPAQFAHARTAIAIFRTLRQGGIVEVHVDGRGQRLLRLTVELQANFALNQPLSPFALAAIELLDPESDTYPLDVISIIEATLENPRAILRAQEHRARGDAVAAMKAEGIEYDERMELLEAITHPQPLKELLDEAFAEYVAEVPWARDFALQPKSVVRDMVERAFGFRDLVSFYQLGRSEGGVLRYLSDAFRAIERTVPERAKSPELEELIDWLGELVRQVDSSLIDEWEELSSPDPEAHRRARALLGLDTDGAETAAALAPPTRSVLTNQRAFLVMLRNALFRRVQAAAFERYGELAELDAARGFGEQKWRDALSGYFDEYDDIRIDADARAASLLELDRSSAPEGFWRFRQVLLDPRGDHDWAIEGSVDLAESEAEGEPVVRVERVGPFAE
ncbi:DEAD/DEAH box helicase [Leucobacter chromiiresistens]|uniref:Helicase conserved C-terminal domain-containing protein n=1 Tax=Leucobacter chromiiresistens TaxID=1079994 RepID=A0A1H0ZJS9_9MICO|nr:DEAD/DEAH box helicase [Leucobacter chromiiresistens]SDQ27597.1 Helicase conserved C-terminal domain-containing protein [Leucobacter chromiiresistens]